MLIGTPPNLLNMIASIYHTSSNQYCDFQYPLRRGIKEGCPLSPSLFILVYEAFHATLTREFPTARFFVYVDDIAVITPDKSHPTQSIAPQFSLGSAQKNWGALSSVPSI